MSDSSTASGLQVKCCMHFSSVPNVLHALLISFSFWWRVQIRQLFVVQHSPTSFSSLSLMSKYSPHDRVFRQAHLPAPVSETHTHKTRVTLHVIWHSQGVNMKVTVLWHVTPCNLVEINQVSEQHAISTFRAAEIYEAAGVIWNAGNFLPVYMPSHSRRQYTSSFKLQLSVF
jgi:hypothetical protein